jgi:hypothetical protein
MSVKELQSLLEVNGDADIERLTALAICFVAEAINEQTKVLKASLIPMERHLADLNEQFHKYREESAKI